MSDQHEPGTADKISDAAKAVAASLRQAVEDGIEAVRPTWDEKVKPAWEEKVVPAWEEKVVPTWESKVAPSIATGAGKVAEWGADVREAADRKSAEFSAGDKPSDKILGGALGVGAAAAALGSSAANWVSREAGQIGHHADEARPAESRPDESGHEEPGHEESRPEDAPEL